MAKQQRLRDRQINLALVQDGDDALMMCFVRIVVNQMMQFRRDLQREGEPKREQRQRGENSPSERRHVGSSGLHALGK